MLAASVLKKLGPVGCGMRGRLGGLMISLGSDAPSPHPGSLKVLYYPTTGLFSTLKVVAVAEQVHEGVSKSWGASLGSLQRRRSGPTAIEVGSPADSIVLPAVMLIKAEMHHIEAACFIKWVSLMRLKKRLKMQFSLSL